jgi:hypothetical protein
MLRPALPEMGFGASSMQLAARPRPPSNGAARPRSVPRAPLNRRVNPNSIPPAAPGASADAQMGMGATGMRIASRARPAHCDDPVGERVGVGAFASRRPASKGMAGPKPSSRGRSPGAARSGGTSGGYPPGGGARGAAARRKDLPMERSAKSRRAAKARQSRKLPPEPEPEASTRPSDPQPREPAPNQGASQGGFSQSAFCMARRKTMITMGSPYFVWINANEIISSWYLLGAACVAPPCEPGCR